MKLRNKLILSCAALAAVATTAVSTTFAWYTSNTTVDATGVTAGTDAANSTTLQISSDGSTWGATVDLKINAGKFAPVSYGKGGDGTDGETTPTADDKFYTWSTTNNAVTTTEASSSSDYIQFTLYFRNLGGSSDNVYLKKFELKNATTGNLPTTQTLVTDGLVASGKTRTDLPAYSVNLLRALDLKLDLSQRTFKDKKTYNVTSDTDDTLVTGTTASTTVYGLEAFHTSTTVAAGNKKTDSIDDTVNSLGTSANAHTYYNAFKGSSITTTNPLTENAALGTNYANANYATTATTSAIDLGAAKGTTSDGTTAQDATYVKSVWTIFLNGWDTMCFDGVKGQKITLSMSFTTAF